MNVKPARVICRVGKIRRALKITSSTHSRLNRIEGTFILPEHCSIFMTTMEMILAGMNMQKKMK